MARHEELYNLDQILSDNFFEFGSSGRIWSRDDVLKSLPHEKSHPFKINNFQAHELAETLVLLTYSLNYRNRNTLRSSIWKNYAGTWKILFHQGTKVVTETPNP